MSFKIKVLVCTEGKHCRKRGGKDVYCRLAEQCQTLGVEDKFAIKKSDCLGSCGRGPAVKIKGFKLTYGRVEPGDCKSILKDLLKARKALKRELIKS